MVRYLLRLAARNLWRRPRRTVLTFLAVAVGLWYFIFLDSFLQGLGRDSVRNLVELETSHVRIHAAGYWDKRDELPLDPLIERPRDIVRRVAAVRGVEGATPRLVFAAQLNNGVDELPVTAVGIDPQADGRVFSLEKYVVQGRWPQPHDEAMGPGVAQAMLGKAVAELMGLGVGDTFTLVTRTRSGAMQAIDLQVAGLLDSPHPAVNASTVYLPLQAAQLALGVGDAATEVDIRGTGEGHAAALQSEIEQTVRARAQPALSVHAWQAMAQDVLAMIQAERAYDMVFLALVFVIALVGVVNTVLLATLERTREIGTLKAMGMTTREIAGVFMAEAGLVGVLGGVTGVAAAMATEFWFVNYGLDLTPLLRDVDVGYPLSGVFTGAWNPVTMAGAFLFGVAVCLVASALPARRAARLDAAAALRNL